ncbi:MULTISPECIES: peroxiredoxin [Desulfofundulus]|jgi:peroxiredoxin (alkyl hydroperoxide reductase subunit C)|uniref:peroxiredoxin n=1 Tax=Desulfofundulus TaxID=2282741 RepID=UPI00068DF497|nr:MULTISPECIES: peroxiredoxin [Desulfofundulus]
MYNHRATFIINPQGRVEYYCVYPREVGRNVDEIIRVLQAIQYAAATGEGVPAQWQPGQPGIRRDFERVGTI